MIMRMTVSSGLDRVGWEREWERDMEWTRGGGSRREWRRGRSGSERGSAVEVEKREERKTG